MVAAAKSEESKKSTEPQRPASAGVEKGGGKPMGLKGASFDEGAAMLAPASQKKPAGAPEQSQSFGAADPRGVLDGVHPALAAKLQNLIANAHAKGLDIQIIEGMRSFQRQNELYAQGRTKPGAKVTNAKAGQSYHNYGVAVDIAFHGAKPYDGRHNWTALGAAGEAAGLAWGGHWGDRPHFEIGGVKIATLQKWYANGGLKNVWNQISAIHGGPTIEEGGEQGEKGQGDKKPVAGGTYKVKPGDTLGAIAQRLFGDMSRWREIAKANGIVDPEKLRVGQELKIPGWKGEGADKGGGAAAVHQVRPGDTLSSIAERYLGSASKWKVIADANGIADPRALKVGAVLKVPGGGAGEGDKAKAPTAKSHTVKAGDTLSGIAERYLGSALKWRELAAANHLDNPNRLKVGTVIRIPA